MGVAGTVIIAAGLAVGLSALVALHLLPTGLSPIRNAVSQYGITRYRTGYRVQTLAYAIAGFGAAVGLSQMRGTASTAPVVALCIVFAVARGVISWFPMDEPGSEMTGTGRRHGMLALVAFVSVGVAAEQLGRLLDEDSMHASMASASNVLAVLILVSFVAMAVGRGRSPGYFGLAERGFYLCATAWFVTVAILLVQSVPG